MTSSLRGEGGGRRMMTLNIFSIGNNSNIDDEGGVKKVNFEVTSFVNTP